MVKEGGESTSILTESVLSFEELTGSKDAKLEPFDYCVHFIFKLVQAFLNNKNLLLNKPNISQLRLYYDIIETIFSLDKIESRATRQESQKKSSEESKKEVETPAEEDGNNEEEDAETAEQSSPFGEGPVLSSFKDLSSKHFDWIYKTLDTVKVFQS